MNIFYLNNDPKLCAQDHCDKHVVKMILEYAQLMSTCHREYGVDDDVLYRSTHKNHPSAIWVRESAHHYDWLHNLWTELNLEYIDRYQKIHASWERLNDVLSNAPDGMPLTSFVDPPQCMPDEFKCPSAIDGYRSYYIGAKAGFATWKTSPPSWWQRKD